MLELALKADPYGKLQLVEGDAGLAGGGGGEDDQGKGKILTLTGTYEAVASGLGAGIVRGIEDIRVGLGIASWHKVAEGAAAYAQNCAKAGGANAAKQTSADEGSAAARWIDGKEREN